MFWGHRTFWDGDKRCYTDNKKSVDYDNPRPCIKCGLNSKDFGGHDPCIANLPGVLNACCGHGTEKGYVQFKNGQIIDGYFYEKRGKNKQKLYAALEECESG